MAKLFNRAKMTTATTGSGTVTLGSASNGFQTFAAAGVSNGDVVQYVIEEGANFEIGTGTYSSSGTSLTRSPTESSNSNNAITLAGQATVSITAVAADLNRLQHGGSDKVTVSSTGASITGNLAVSGTVDGRNVASDGSKLDGIEANAKNDQTITAGGGLAGGGTGDVTLSHSDTSSQASVNNSGGTVIQDVTVDTYGHVTGLTSYNLDGRYYTETEADSRFVNVAGDTMTGHLGIGGTATDANWSDATYGNTEVSIDGGGGYGVLHFRGDGAGSTDTRYSVGVGDGIFYMAYDDVDGVHRAKINASHQLILNEGSGDVRAFHDGYHPNADAWTTSRTLTLSGEASGSVSWDGSANATLSVTLNDSALDDQYVTVGARHTGNADSLVQTSKASIRIWDVSTATDDPSGATDGLILSAGWDSSSWGIQQYHDFHSNDLYLRSKNNNSMTSWDRVFHDTYHPNADTLTTARTINGVSFNGSANITVADSTKLPLTGGTITGDLNVNGVRFRAGSNVARNLKIQPTGSDSTVGLTMFNGAGAHCIQLYGGSTDYGFLDANWGGWDIKKTKNGSFQVDEGSGLQRVFNDGYHPNADKWTTARTLSLTGDVTGSVSWDGSANASLSTTVGNDSHTHSISTITDEHRLFNNMGNNHGTYTNFNSISQFGVRFVQGGTNGPTGVAGHQWYGFTLGLGNEYTGLNSSGDYGSQFYWARQGQSGGAYIWIRDQENGNWGSWRKPYAGKADAWTSSRTLSLTGAVTGSVSWDGSGNASLSTSFNDNGPNYIDVATGNYGTVKVDDDRGVSGAWAGYAIRDDWVFMSDGANNAGIFNDTDNEWAILCRRNAEVEFYHNGSMKFETSSNGIEMSGRIDMNNNDIYGCDQLFHHGDTNTYMQFHAADQWRVVCGGTERLEVTNGTITANGTFNNTSDERLKENVKPIQNALADICQLEGVTFDWKDTGEHGQGFIAQQVEPIIPEIVKTDEDDGMKSVNYVGLIGHLVEAIKTQQTQIDDLKAEIQSIKS